MKHGALLLRRGMFKWQLCGYGVLLQPKTVQIVTQTWCKSMLSLRGRMFNWQLCGYGVLLLLQPKTAQIVTQTWCKLMLSLRGGMFNWQLCGYGVLLCPRVSEDLVVTLDMKQAKHYYWGERFLSDNCMDVEYYYTRRLYRNYHTDVVPVNVTEGRDV